MSFKLCVWAHLHCRQSLRSQQGAAAPARVQRWLAALLQGSLALSRSERQACDWTHITLENCYSTHSRHPAWLAAAPAAGCCCCCHS
jgi:hypothetical protein